MGEGFVGSAVRTIERRVTFRWSAQRTLHASVLEPLARASYNTPFSIPDSPFAIPHLPHVRNDHREPLRLPEVLRVDLRQRLERGVRVPPRLLPQACDA